jgi:hypothetical protein
MLRPGDFGAPREWRNKAQNRALMFDRIQTKASASQVKGANIFIFSGVPAFTRESAGRRSRVQMAQNDFRLTKARGDFCKPIHLV